MPQTVAKARSVVLMYPTGGANEDCFTNSLVGAISYDGAHNGYLADAMGILGLYVDSNRELGSRRFMRYRLCPDCRNVINRGEILTGKMLVCHFCHKDVPNPAFPDWLWWVDTDISFPYYGILDTMLESADPVECPVLSALYFGYMNNKALTPVWYGRDLKDGRIEPLTSFKSGLNRLGVCGMGCCLIHRSVFEKFGLTYQKTGWLYFGRDRAPWTPLPTDNNDMTNFGEDNCFCWRCNEQGIPIYGNADIIVNHSKKRFENLQTFIDSFARGEVIQDEAGVAYRFRREPPKTISANGVPRLDQPDYPRHEPGAEARRSMGSERIAAAFRGEHF